MNQFDNILFAAQRLHVEQVFEGFEILGFETRNKYRILDEHKRPVAYAAEQSKGILASILRQFMGHWRSFDVMVFNQDRQHAYTFQFPFRWFFKTLIVVDSGGKEIGHLQQRFAFFRKKFDVIGSHGRVLARINSPLFKFWTFEFIFNGRKLGTVQKKFAGVMSEFFTDKDNFIVSYAQPDLELQTKVLMLATCLMVDVVYFEKKGSGSILDG